MVKFIETIFRRLPSRYKKLGDNLTMQQFSDLIMMLISFKFRRMLLPKEINIKSEGKVIVITGELLELADKIASEIVFYLGKYGMKTELIIREICSNDV